MVAMFVRGRCGDLIAFGDFFTVAMMSRMLFSGTSMTSMISGLSMIPQAHVSRLGLRVRGYDDGSPPVHADHRLGDDRDLGIDLRRCADRHSLRDCEQSPRHSRSATLLPHVVIEVVLVAAFGGYMSGGPRPNVYFRRRVHA